MIRMPNLPLQKQILIVFKNSHKYHLDEHDTKWYPCQNYPFKTKYYHYLKIHINVKHLDKPEIKWYECEKCPYKAKSSYDLKKHTNLKEQEIKWHECEKCP